MPQTIDQIRSLLSTFPKGTRLSGNKGWFSRTVDPVPLDSLVFDIEAGTEGVCLRGTNVSEKVNFNECTDFKIDDSIIDRSDYSLEGEGEAIIFRTPVSKDSKFSFQWLGPRFEPIKYPSVPLLSRKNGRYKFTDEQLEALAKEAVGERYTLDKIRQVTDDPRVTDPYTHCVVLEAFVGENGIYATVEMRTDMGWGGNP